MFNVELSCLVFVLDVGLQTFMLKRVFISLKSIKGRSPSYPLIFICMYVQIGGFSVPKILQTGEF